MFTCGEVKYGSAGDDCILINLKTVGLLHYSCLRAIIYSSQRCSYLR